MTGGGRKAAPPRRMSLIQRLTASPPRRLQLQPSSLQSETERAYDPSDCRETAARFRFPVQRQFWELRDDGTRANSADGDARGMPPYILVMDLVFSAVFARSAQLTRLGLHGVLAFFQVYVPISWLWMLANNRFNLFDPEDLSFEVFNLLLMAGAMVVALNAEECLCAVSSQSFTETEKELPACARRTEARCLARGEGVDAR